MNDCKCFVNVNDLFDPASIGSMLAMFTAERHNSMKGRYIAWTVTDYNGSTVINNRCPIVHVENTTFIRIPRRKGFAKEHIDTPIRPYICVQYGWAKNPIYLFTQHHPRLRGDGKTLNCDAARPPVHMWKKWWRRWMWLQSTNLTGLRAKVLLVLNEIAATNSTYKLALCKDVIKIIYQYVFGARPPGI